MRVETIELNDQQLTVCQPNKNETPTETIVYYHGVGGEGIDELPLAYQLVKQGYRVILPDAYLHSHKDRVPRAKQNVRFFEIIDVTSQRLSLIYDWLKKKTKEEAPTLHVGGTSMGGIITAMSLTQYPFIKKAALLMGTAKLTDFYHYITADIKKGNFPLSETEEQQLLSRLATRDLSQNIHALNDRDLFIWHGEADDYVPFDLTDQFVQELTDSKDYQGHLTYVKEPNQGHKVSRLAKDKCSKFFGGNVSLEVNK
ncbi:MAG: prolyl oligopeptidase family serine peptidase [Bacillota bacterium]